MVLGPALRSLLRLLRERNPAHRVLRRLGDGDGRSGDALWHRDPAPAGAASVPRRPRHAGVLPRGGLWAYRPGCLVGRQQGGRLPGEGRAVAATSLAGDEERARRRPHPSSVAAPGSSWALVSQEKKCQYDIDLGGGGGESIPPGQVVRKFREPAAAKSVSELWAEVREKRLNAAILCVSLGFPLLLSLIFAANTVLHRSAEPAHVRCRSRMAGPAPAAGPFWSRWFPPS